VGSLVNRNGIILDGIALPRPSERLEAHVNQYIDTAEVDELARPYWTGLGDWRQADFAPTRRVKLGRLYWPTGASRFAIGRFLASEAQLDLMRRDANISVSNPNLPLNLTFDDGQDPSPGKRSFTTPMFLLPSTPFIEWTGNDGPKGYYLVTVVDERYWWWRTGAKIDSATDWKSFLNSIATALNVMFTFSEDDLPEEYLSPSANLAGVYEYLPLLFDAALYSIQRRLVRGLDGTLTIQDPSSAIDAVNDLFDDNRDRREFGGIYRTDTVSPHQELSLLVPNKFRVRFRQQPTRPSPFTPTTYTSYTKNLADLSLDEYANIKPKDAEKIFQSDAIAINQAGSGADDNADDLQKLTTQLASDWYLWQTADMHSVYGGILPWDTEAMSDFVEYDGYAMRTFIRRAPLDDLASRVHHSPDPDLPYVSRRFPAVITGRTPTGAQSGMSYASSDYLWAYSWQAVGIAAGGVTYPGSAPYPYASSGKANASTMQVGIGDGTGGGNNTVPSESGATSGSVVLNLIVTIGLGAPTTYSATITSSMNATSMLAAIQAVAPAAITLGAVIPNEQVPGVPGLVGGLILSYTAGSGTSASLVLGTNTLQPSTATNVAVEISGFSVPVGRVVQMEKQVDGPAPTITISKTHAGDGSTHTTWTATIANAVDGSWEPYFDGHHNPSSVVAQGATASVVQSDFNSYFSPATFTVSGSDGGPYTIVCTSDNKDHNLRGNGQNLIDNGVYGFSASYLGPRMTYVPAAGTSGGQISNADSRGPNSGGFSSSLHLIATGSSPGNDSQLGAFGSVSTVPIDGANNIFPGCPNGAVSRFGNVPIPTDGSPNGLTFQVDNQGFPYLYLPGYAPATPTNWNTTPTTLPNAIDRLAVYCILLQARVNALDSAGTSKP
jgi:hypothetical protein